MPCFYACFRIRGSSPSSCGSSPLNITSTPPPDTSSPGGKKVRTSFPQAGGSQGREQLQGKSFWAGKGMEPKRCSGHSPCTAVPEGQRAAAPEHQQPLTLTRPLGCVVFQQSCREQLSSSLSTLQKLSDTPCWWTLEVLALQHRLCPGNPSSVPVLLQHNPGQFRARPGTERLFLSQHRAPALLWDCLSSTQVPLPALSHLNTCPGCFQQSLNAYGSFIQSKNTTYPDPYALLQTYLTFSSQKWWLASKNCSNWNKQ